MPAAGAALIAPAKVNLALHVTGRRADGYHLLDSVAVFADFGDRVEIAPSRRLEVRVSGRFAAHAPGDRDNLAWRAAEAFFRHTGRPPEVSIGVEKNIPAGAGLGGGSADAAAVLRALDSFTGAGVSPRDLGVLGLALGADVPMCLSGCALRARGIGEDIAPLAGWPALPMVLVWPGRAVSTPAVFSALASRENPPLPELPGAETLAVTDIAAWLGACRNDLEAPALQIAPEIGAALGGLRATDGCLVARMSGSGSACFGLYAERAEAEAAAARLAAAQPDWWVRAATGG